MNHEVRIFDGVGNFLGAIGSGSPFESSKDGEFSGPLGVAVDAEGSLYVADSGNGRVQKFGPPPTAVLAAS